jgi:hypothetical protein
MKIINCGRVIYLICGNHVATIVYDYNNGHPNATIYYDGKLGETIEAENGQTLRLAIICARYTIRTDEYIAKLRKRA